MDVLLCLLLASTKCLALVVKDKRQACFNFTIYRISPKYEAVIERQHCIVCLVVSYYGGVSRTANSCDISRTNHSTVLARSCTIPLTAAEHTEITAPFSNKTN